MVCAKPYERWCFYDSSPEPESWEPARAVHYDDFLSEVASERNQGVVHLAGLG